MNFQTHREVFSYYDQDPSRFLNRAIKKAAKKFLRFLSRDVIATNNLLDDLNSVIN